MALLAFGSVWRGILLTQPVFNLYPYWIDGVLDIAASAWSKVLISLTPRRRQLARWQRSRACKLGY